MPKQEPRLVEDFLIPALNQNQFPGNLMWENVAAKIFVLRWCHKSSSSWTENDTAVFVGWDKLKNRYHPEREQYLMYSKQRFRSALYKIDTIEILHSPDKSIKRYRILKKSGVRKKRKSSRQIQEIPNSPLPSSDEALSIYSETAMDEEQLSPASSTSNWDSEERLNLFVTAEGAFNMSWSVDDSILNVEQPMELLLFRSNSEQRENVLQEAEVSSSTSFQDLRNSAFIEAATPPPQDTGNVSNNFQLAGNCTKEYNRIPEAQEQYFVQYMVPEPAGTNYNSGPSYDSAIVNYLVNFLNSSDTAPTPPCNASAEVTSSIYDATCISPPFLEDNLDLEEILDYDGIIPAL